MSVTQFKHAVVVLGMHRSGTSALAGMLGLAGLDMPRTLLPPSSGNEKGFWESEAIKSFDEDVLKEFGSSWHGVEAISLSNLSRSAISRLRKTAKEILADEYQGSPAITLKDPRMCRLLPIWQPVLSELSDRTSYSIILRNPIEVAQSLARRNEFDPDIGTLLWLRYLLDAEFSTRGSPRVFLTFNGLLADWRAEMSRLGSKLELPFDPDTIDADQAGDFLESGLRHHRIADEQAFLELRNLPQVVDAYRILLGFADDHPQSDAEYEALDRIRHDLDRMSSVIASVTERARLDRKRFIGAMAQAYEVFRPDEGFGKTRDGKCRCIRGEKRVWPDYGGSLGRHVCLDRGVLEYGLDNEVCAGKRRIIDGRLDPLQNGGCLRLAQLPSGDLLRQGLLRVASAALCGLKVRVDQNDVHAGPGADERDPGTHHSSAKNADIADRGLGHVCGSARALLSQSLVDETRSDDVSAHLVGEEARKMSALDTKASVERHLDAFEDTRQD